MRANRTVVVSALLVLAALAGAAIAQRLPPQRQWPPQRDPGDPYDFDNAYVLVIPPGTYTSIVVSSGHGRGRDTTIFNLRDGERDFPFYVTPGSTQVIPFEHGWTVGDSVRLWGTEDQRFTAWGVTADGPVQFPMETPPRGTFNR